MKKKYKTKLKDYISHPGRGKMGMLDGVSLRATEREVSTPFTNRSTFVVTFGGGGVGCLDCGGGVRVEDVCEVCPLVGNEAFIGSLVSMAIESRVDS